MSIGNLKDTGNQGNNMPWQWKVLQGLQAILDETALPLTCAEDSVKICDANGDTLGVNGDGSIDVNVIKAVGIYQEDNSHTTGDKGAFVLAVRNDLNTDMTNTNGDYSPIAVNSKGGVSIQDGGNSITVDTTQLPATLGEKASTGSVSVTLSNDELGIARTTGIIRPTGATAIGNVNTVPTSGRFFSVSVANVGAANGSLLGVANSIKPGEVLNFSADAINNYFTTFAYDATGTEFIIIFVY